MARPRQQRDAVCRAVLVDHPLLVGAKRAVDVDVTVAIDRQLRQHGMRQAFARFDAELGAVHGRGTPLGPDAVVDRAHLQLTVIARQRVEDAVRRDVGRLTFGHEQRRRRRDQHEQLGAAPLELVDEHGRATSLRTQHHRVVVVGGELDRAIAELACGMDHTVERTEARLGLVERTARRSPDRRGPL